MRLQHRQNQSAVDGAPVPDARKTPAPELFFETSIKKVFAIETAPENASNTTERIALFAVQIKSKTGRFAMIQGFFTEYRCTCGMPFLESEPQKAVDHVLENHMRAKDWASYDRTEVRVRVMIYPNPLIEGGQLPARS